MYLIFQWTISFRESMSTDDKIVIIFEYVFIDWQYTFGQTVFVGIRVCTGV